MPLLRLVILGSILLSGPALAQRWIPYSNTLDGFRLMAPGEFEIEEIDFETEYGIVVPARIYTHENDAGRFSVTVVDYRDSQRLHEERIRGARWCLYRDLWAGGRARLGRLCGE